MRKGLDPVLVYRHVVSVEGQEDEEGDLEPEQVVEADSAILHHDRLYDRLYNRLYNAAIDHQPREVIGDDI